MNNSYRVRTIGKATHFRDALKKVAGVFTFGVNEIWEEVYFAFFVSEDEDQDAFLAAALMKDSKQLVDYSKYENWTTEYFRARKLLEDFWVTSQERGEIWHRVLFCYSCTGKMKIFFGEKPIKNTYSVSEVPVEAWTRFLRESFVPSPTEEEPSEGAQGG